MSKFNRRGYSDESEAGMPEVDQELHVWSGETPEIQSTGEEQEEKQGLENRGTETVYIPVERIRPNSKNEYKMSDIEKLSGMIKLAGGIWQNLIVKPADEEGYYTITTGERRWRAAKLLCERGEYPEELQGKVPCTIKKMDDIELPLNEELKEDFAILVTNQYRTKTDGELMMEMQKWREIIKELRKADVKYLPAGYDGEEKIQIAGTPTRKLLAGQLGISTGSVSRLEHVEKNAGSHLMELLMTNKMNLSAAEELARLDKKGQEKAIRHLRENSEVISAESAKKEVNTRIGKIKLEKQEVTSDLESIMDILGEQAELTDSDYRKYKKAIGQIRKLLS